MIQELAFAQGSTKMPQYLSGRSHSCEYLRIEAPPLLFPLSSPETSAYKSHGINTKNLRTDKIIDTDLLDNETNVFGIVSLGGRFPNIAHDIAYFHAIIEFLRGKKQLLLFIKWLDESKCGL